MVAGAAQAQNPVLAITETSETSLLGGITATYNGSGVPVTVPVTLTGAADHWTIQLPNTFSLALAGPIYVGEPESATTVNEVDVTQPTFLTWDSDIGVPAGVGGPFANPVTITDAGTFAAATAPQTFNLVLYDQPERTVPDATSTGMLFGLALVGLCGVARFGRVRHEAV